MRKLIISTLLLIPLICSQIEVESQSYNVERIYVHVQKNTYIAGEAVWYKIYCLDAKTKKLSDISNVAYVELINELGNSIVQQSIILKNGMGNGGFVLSENLPAGNYAINAYTQWMKGISKDLVGISQIFVFNSSNTEEFHPVDSSTLSKKSFLVKDLFTKDTLFNVRGNSAKAVTNSEQSVERLEISSIIDEYSNRINFFIGRKNYGVKTSGINYSFWLYSHKGKEKIEDFKFIGPSYVIPILLDRFNPGNYGVCITDNQNKVVAKQTIHISNGVNGKKYSTDTIKAGVRNIVKIPFQLSDFIDGADILYLSASVKLKEPESKSCYYDMVDFYETIMDFGNQYYPYLNKIKPVSINNWISDNIAAPLWCNIETSYRVVPGRYAECNGYVLEGIVTEKESKQPASNTMVYLSKIGAYADISPYLTKHNGRFFFSLPLKKGLHDIAITHVGNRNEELILTLTEKFNTHGIVPEKWNGEFLTTKTLDYIKTCWENYRIQKLFDKSVFKNFQDTTIFKGERNFFGTPHSSIKIKDYVKLDSLEEYFYEFLTNVKLRYRKNTPVIKIYNPNQFAIMEEKPLLIFDGMIVNDYTEILEKSVTEIEKIEVFPFEYLYRSALFHGVVHVVSNNKKCELSALPPNTERYYLPLFDKKLIRSEYNPQNAKNHIPDFRTDLLWNPDIEIHEDKNLELSFYASDVKGEYELIIEGISAKGKPVYYNQKIIIE